MRLIAVFDFHVSHWGDWATAGAAFIACFFAFIQFMKWMWKVFKSAISAAVDLSDTGHLVQYHLGPNGTTPPVYQRIRRLEEAHHIEHIEDHHDEPTESA